jgi:hypothetical protein
MGIAHGAATNEARIAPDESPILEPPTRLRSQEEDDPEPHPEFRAKEQSSKKDAKDIEEMRKFQSPTLASKKIVLKCTRNVLR